ncbi:MAG: hypothetical protein AAF685_11160 [Cyanobacteria bacterium P01_C01_bin.89]
MVVQKFSLKSFGEHLGHALKQHYLNQYYPQFRKESLGLLETLNPSENFNLSGNSLEELSDIRWGDCLQVPAIIQVRITESHLYLWSLGDAIKLNHPGILHHSALSSDQAQRLRFAIDNAPRGTQAVIERLGRLDFGPLVRKLWACHGDNGQDGWSRSRLYGAVQSYASFLLDVALQPEMSFSATSSDMDEVWHCHILQTQKYTNDCKILLGYYLHHEASSAPLQIFDPPKSLLSSGGGRAHESIHASRPSVVEGTGFCRTDLPEMATVRAA